MPSKSMRRRASNWPLWKVLLASLVGFGVLGLLPGLMPPISIPTIRLGLLWLVATTAVCVWAWATYNWWARVATAALLSIQWLVIAARSWLLVVASPWMLLVPVLLAYLLAWALPALDPRLSVILWREQTAPQTRIGRALLVLALAVGPSAGVIGASLGMFGSRFGESESVLLAMVVLSSAVGFGFAFAASYQIWPERPWANDTEPQRKAST